MSRKTVRILMAKFGEGYEEALTSLARAFSEAGFEVIYTESQEPRAIVAAALQESVDHIGITTLPDAQVGQFQELFDLLRREDAENIRVTAGGFFKDEDVSRIKELGVVEFFPKGTTHGELIQWARDHIRPLDFEDL